MFHYIQWSDTRFETLRHFFVPNQYLQKVCEARKNACLQNNEKNDILQHQKMKSVSNTHMQYASMNTTIYGRAVVSMVCFLNNN